MNHFAKNILLAGLGGLALSLLELPVMAAQPAAVPASLPLFFETGPGPAGSPSQFVARGQDYQFLVSAAGAQIALRKTGAQSAAVRMQFVGANPQAPIHGDAELPGKINYLTGNNPAQWRTGVAMFAKVRVGELYPGINLVYYGNQRQLEYDFDIAPGVDPEVIAFHFDGVEKITVNSQGELILSMTGGEIRQAKPAIYQLAGGARKEIAGGYRLVDAHTVAFAVGKYDHSQTLVIDPVLGYSTYFGGTAGDIAWGVALDTNGIIYIAGETFSPKFFTNGWSGGPAFSTYGAFQTNYNGGKYAGDAFVAKFGLASNWVFYLTYLGGTGNDRALAIAVDNSGDAYVTGYTDSTNFPAYNAISNKIAGTLNVNLKAYPVDAFVAELDPSGSNLVYSTYLGGNAVDGGTGITVDNLGNAYVTGFTYSSNFPTVANITYSNNSTLYTLPNKQACSNSIYFNANAFIAKIGPGGSNLVSSTYFGGTNFDQGNSIAVDTNGFVYVTGFTGSTNFPTLNAVVQQLVWTNVVGTNTTLITNNFNGYRLNGSTNRPSSSDAFVAKFDWNGTNPVLVYSTLLGGTNSDVATHIAVDNNGNAYVTGWTISTNFPNTVGTSLGLHSFVATNTSLNLPATNVFLTKISNPNGTTNVSLAWSAVFGGWGADVGYGVALDPAGNNVFVTGSASSTNFPAFNVPGFISPTNFAKKNSGKSDAFVIAFTNDASALLYSGYLGGSENDFGYSIAVDANDNAYVVGQTLSTNFPTFNGALTYRNGTNDAFLTQIILNPNPPTIATNAQPAGQTNAVGSFVYFSVSGGVSGTPPLIYQWQKDGTNLVNGTNSVNGASVITSGATNDTLFISNVQTSNSGNYSVIITNYGGSVASSNAFLLVTNIPPEFTQPTNQLVGAGLSAVFSVTVTNGTPPFSYQWQIQDTNSVSGWTNLANGGRITGATSNVLTISNVQTNDNGATYSVIVTNYPDSATISNANVVTSSNAVLTVTAVPVITLQPASQAIAVTSNMTFTVAAVGSVPLHFQWQIGTNNPANLVNRGNISGVTISTLTITNAQTTNNGDYTVVVTNIAGAVTSSVASLLVTNIPPFITTQPVSQTNGAGTTVAFAVSAIGTPQLHYQWQVNGTNLVNNTNTVNGVKVITSGATSNLLTLSNVQTNNAGNYSVTITNFGGSTNSFSVALTVQTTPIITRQPAPASQTNEVGNTVTYSVAAIGTVPLHYQWQVNGANVVNVTNHISGASTTNLIISKAQITNSGNYTVIVTNVAGSVTSSPVSVLVTNFPPVITLPPIGQTNGVGSMISLTVAATGTAPLKYQWRLNGTNVVNSGRHGQISGATSTNLIINPAQTTNSGDYTVVISNAGGSVTSSVAVVTVTAVPFITVQPADQAVAVSSNATFAVTAVGKGTLHYQWQMNETNLVDGTNSDLSQISGSTTTNLTIINAQMNNSGGYSVVVSNSFGSVASSNAVLTVTNIPPAITAQPTNQAVAIGSNVTFVVTATGSPPLSYQWQVNGTNLLDGIGVSGEVISGSATNVLTIMNAQTNDSGNYSVVVTNLGGSVTSSNASLIVTGSPIITSQPASQAVTVGSTAAFAVTAVGSPPLSYQWQMNGTNLMDGTNLLDGDIISGSTTTDLTILNAQTNNSGSYSVVVSNSYGSVTSSNAVLTVVQLMVVAWGDNSYGQTNVPVAATNVMAIAGGGYHNLALQTNGTVVAWGLDNYGQTDVPADLTNVAAIAAGEFHSLALKDDGTVVAWGYNGDGETNVPSGLTNAVAIAAGFSHSLALEANGTVVAWGYNADGETNVPADLTNVVAIAGSGYDSLALQANGTVVAWGYNADGETNVPADLTNVMAIAGGGFFSLALEANGTVVAWGDNTYGQTNVPPDLTNVVAIAGGYFHSLALQANGTVVAWGADNAGQTNVPADLTNVVAIAGGYLHSLALENDGSPFIVGQPVSQTALTNTTVTFTVTALGAPALSYQWQKDGSSLTDGGNVSGSASATLTLTDVQTADAAGYTVVITNAIGSVTSSNAVLTVTEVAPAIILSLENQPVPWSPAIRSITVSGGGNIVIAGDSGGFIPSGIAGASNGTYYLLASSNLLVPLTNWTAITTGHFDGGGGFIYTNTAQTNAPQQFYLLQLP